MKQMKDNSRRVIVLAIVSTIGRDGYEPSPSIPAPPRVSEKTIEWLNTPIGEPIDAGKTPTRAGALVSVLLLSITALAVAAVFAVQP
jgi:hypothetical protein